MHMHKKPSLVLDARMVRHSGIGVYIRNLIPYLNQEFDLTLIGDKEMLEIFECKIIHSNISVYSPKELLGFSKKIGRADVFWTPHFNYPLWPVSAKLKLATVHDMYHFAHFDKLSLVQKLYAQLVISNTLRVADRIITVSDFTKNEIANYFPNVDKGKIIPIHIGVDTATFRPDLRVSHLQNVRTKYNLPDHYLLFVGNLKHNKNAIALVKAVQTLEAKNQLHDHKIVFVGKKEGFRIGDNEVMDYIAANHLQHLVTFTGFVDDEDLPTLYSAASLFVFPSLYEGFGLPPLEAMACGCPVLCSNMASMPEVCGDAVFYFDPKIPESLSTVLGSLLANEIFKKSKSFIAKGWIKQYDWSITAEKHVQLIKNALS